MTYDGRRLTGYCLVHEQIISRNDDLESHQTEIAEGKTIKGLLKFARMKKLDPNSHFIEAEYIEFIEGIKVPDSEYIGHLNELNKQKSN